ncbi:hypothetical protein NL676_022276 [Syzygium grande]|nr:hypothetical protein NL676_022276 [Syzygium grande]
MLVKKWWDIYEDESLDYKNCPHVTAAGAKADAKLVNMEPFITALSKVGAVQYVIWVATGKEYKNDKISQSIEGSLQEEYNHGTDTSSGGSLGRRTTCREDIKMLVKKWWDIYEDESLDYKNCPHVTAAGAKADAKLVNMEPFITALSKVGAVQYVKAPSAA